MEKLFTPKQLIEIQDKAKWDFDNYFDTYVIEGDVKETSIKTISKNKHLIFVEGNEDTGFKHLYNRHSYFSHKNYWRLNDEKEFKLDDPSKFQPKMIPILDYVQIADTIFCEENKNITKNNRPALFDKYTGEYQYFNSESEKYHLLTYKDTKIIHTFFPDKRKYNPKRKCRFGKGVVSSTIKLPEGFNDLLLPYENEMGNVVYSFLIRKYYSERIERIIIQRHDGNGNPIEQYFFGERTFEEFERFSREEMKSLQYCDLRGFEKIINELDDRFNNLSNS